MGIDSVISPKSLTANEIVRYVRAMENTTGSSALTLHRIANDQVEALEFLVTGCTCHLGSPWQRSPEEGIWWLHQPPRQTDHPQGSDHFQRATIIVVTTADRVIGDINDILRTSGDKRMNYRMIAYVLSRLLGIECLFMLPAAISFFKERVPRSAPSLPPSASC